jgi:hypothetical protein
MDPGGTLELTTPEKAELIRLVRKTMGENHPTGERIVKLVRDGHIALARNALSESIRGLKELIEMDEEPIMDDMTLNTPAETQDEDKSDLDKYKMLLEALNA